MHAFNLVGPHFLQSAFVKHGKAADILNDGAGCQSTTAAVNVSPPLGTIHKGRPQNFRDFGPPPPLSAFWLDL